MKNSHGISALAPTGPRTRRQWLGLAAALGIASCRHEKPRVAYVNSYAPGYAPADAIAKAVRDGLTGIDLELQTHDLDALRDPAALPRNADRAAVAIRAFRPNLILAFGDEAMRHVVVPYFRAGPTPVLFCGVDWSADAYEVPNKFVTGMLETPPVEETIALVKTGAPTIKRLFVLAEDTPRERANRRFLDPIYWKSGLSTTYGLVSDFEHWKRAFGWANRNADVIFFISKAAIRNWEEEQAIAHIREHIRVPVFCCDRSMIRYCVVGRVPVAAEGGEWLAVQALRILGGTKPEAIPLARNTQSRIVGNADLAARIPFPLPPEATLSV